MGLLDGRLDGSDLGSANEEGEGEGECVHLTSDCQLQ